MMRPFQAAEAATKNVAVATSSTAPLLIANQAGCVQVRVLNDGTATAWFAFGGSAVTASMTADKPIGAGSCEVFTVDVPTGGLYVATIAAGATGKIYFTPGVGI